MRRDKSISRYMSSRSAFDSVVGAFAGRVRERVAIVPRKIADLRLLIYHLPAHNRVAGLDRAQGLRCNGKGIAIEHNQVGKSTGCHGSPLLLVERRPRASIRVGPKRLADADLLLGDPPAGVLVVERSTGHRRIDAEHGIERGYGPVGAECQRRVGIAQSAERAGRVEPPRSDALLEPTAIIDRVVG